MSVVRFHRNVSPRTNSHPYYRSDHVERIKQKKKKPKKNIVLTVSTKHLRPILHNSCQSSSCSSLNSRHCCLSPVLPVSSFFHSLRGSFAFFFFFFLRVVVVVSEPPFTDSMSVFSALQNPSVS